MSVSSTAASRFRHTCSGFFGHYIVHLHLSARVACIPSPYRVPVIRDRIIPLRPWEMMSRIRVLKFLKVIGLLTAVTVLLTAVVELAKAWKEAEKAKIELEIKQREVAVIDTLVQQATDTFLNRQPDSIRSFVREIQTDIQQRGLDIELQASFEYTLLDASMADYAVGRYLIEDVPSGIVTMKFLDRVVLPRLARYTTTQPAHTEIIGSADGIPVREDAYYRGDLGPVRIRYRHAGSELPKAISLQRGDRLTNEIIALLRGYAVYDYLRHNEILARSNVSLTAVTDARVDKAHRTVELIICIPGALESRTQDLSGTARALLRLQKPELERDGCRR